MSKRFTRLAPSVSRSARSSALLLVVTSIAPACGLEGLEELTANPRTLATSGGTGMLGEAGALTGGAAGSTESGGESGAAGSFDTGGKNGAGAANGGNAGHESGGVGGESAGASGASAGTTGNCAGAGGTGGAGISVGLELYWKFDEADGGTALDGSGNGLNGTYLEPFSPPTAAAAEVPVVLRCNDPASRAFTWGQYVELATSTANFERIRRTNDFTVSVWYRMTSSDIGTTGSELVSLGDHYGLRLTRTRIEWNKSWTDDPSIIAQWAQHWCTPVTPYLDGAWHHLVGVQSSVAGMTVYLDGQLLSGCYFNTNADRSTSNVVYTGSGQNFRVGRHGNTSRKYDFQGNIDDVRFYSRALSATDILALAQGQEPPGM